MRRGRIVWQACTSSEPHSQERDMDTDMIDSNDAFRLLYISNRIDIQKCILYVCAIAPWGYYNQRP